MGRGCNTIQSPPVATGASRRSDGYALKTAGNTPGDLPGAPEGEGKLQGELNIGQKSAEGIVVEGNEPGGGDAPFKRRHRRTHRDEGPNGGRGRMALQSEGTSKRKGSMKTMQTQMDLAGAALRHTDRGRDEFIAARLAESPTGEDRLMEAICERENRRSKAQSEGRGTASTSVSVSRATWARRAPASTGKPSGDSVSGCARSRPAKGAGAWRQSPAS